MELPVFTDGASPPGFDLDSVETSAFAIDLDQVIDPDLDPFETSAVATEVDQVVDPNLLKRTCDEYNSNLRSPHGVDTTPTSSGNGSTVRVRVTGAIEMDAPTSGGRRQHRLGATTESRTLTTRAPLKRFREWLKKRPGFKAQARRRSRLLRQEAPDKVPPSRQLEVSVSNIPLDVRNVVAPPVRHELILEEMQIRTPRQSNTSRHLPSTVIPLLQDETESNLKTQTPPFFNEPVISIETDPSIDAHPPLKTASVLIKPDDIVTKKTKEMEANLFNEVLQATESAADDLKRSLSETSLYLEQSNEPCPLSNSTSNENVGTHGLKVIMMGDLCDEKLQLARAIGGKNPIGPHDKVGVDVFPWTTEEGLTLSIWNVHSVGAGAHPSTQRLFYSAESLYILVWDLGVANKMTHRTKTDHDDEYDNEYDNYILRELQQRQADRALHHDIEDHVLAWLERIIPHGSAVLPVACLTAEMNEFEVQRRCSILQTLLVNHPAFCGDNAPKLIFGKNDNVLMVNLASGVGLPELQETVLAIGQERVFAHMGSEVNHSTMQILETIRRLKQDHKVITVDHLMAEMNGPTMKMEIMTEALQFLSSIGEILYYGESTDEMLSRYVILTPQWLGSALYNILEPGLRHALRWAHLFDGTDDSAECDTLQTFLNQTNSSCPILSAKDSTMLWQFLSFTSEPASRNVKHTIASNTKYEFLERLLVYSKILLPLNFATERTYFVPSLLNETVSQNMVWSFKTNDWMTSLCHSWQLLDGLPTSLMEHITTDLLHDLSHTFHDQLNEQLISTTDPSGSNNFIHDHQPIGNIKLNQVLCWKSSVLVKVSTIYNDCSSHGLREFTAEIYVAVVDDQNSIYPPTMKHGMKRAQRLIVCGKGQRQSHGRKLWKGGYKLVLNSIKASLANMTRTNRQVVCPNCLADPHLHPSHASTWSWNDVKHSELSAQRGEQHIRCGRGHSVHISLICGREIVGLSSGQITPPNKKISSLLESVVLVCLWNSQEKRVVGVGSGFIVDQALGLIVTAKHVMENAAMPNHGFENYRAIIGVIPDGGGKAVFCYFAKMVSQGGDNVDACVLRITTYLKQDVEGDREGCTYQLEDPVCEIGGVLALPMTCKFEQEEAVRIVGFNQGGEGVYKQGNHIDRSPDVAFGFICKLFESCVERGNENGNSSPPISNKLRKEIVVIGTTICGQSGGPCVNGDGVVVGILSRGIGERSYLVPSSELRKLVRTARYQARRDSSNSLCITSEITGVSSTTWTIFLLICMMIFMSSFFPDYHAFLF